MKAWLKTRKPLYRWLLYYALTSAPGVLVFVMFGFFVALLFELVTWVPQQRFFDFLGLGETLPTLKPTT